MLALAYSCADRAQELRPLSVETPERPATVRKSGGCSETSGVPPLSTWQRPEQASCFCEPQERTVSARAHCETKVRASNARLELAQPLLRLLVQPLHRLSVGRHPLLPQGLGVDVLPMGDRLVAHCIRTICRRAGTSS